MSDLHFISSLFSLPSKYTIHTTYMVMSSSHLLFPGWLYDLERFSLLFFNRYYVTKSKNDGIMILDFFLPIWSKDSPT